MLFYGLLILLFTQNTREMAMNRDKKNINIVFAGLRLVHFVVSDMLDIVECRGLTARPVHFSRDY